MNRKALNQLKRVVIEAPDDRFCMNVFEAELPCGTVRCAAGWASVDPWFQANLPLPQQWLHPNRDLARAFDISHDDANNLFGLDLCGVAFDPTDPKHERMRRDVTKLEVIADINRLLRGRPTKPYAATRSP